MDSTSHRVSPGPGISPDPGALLDFIDELRRAGYNIGCGQYVAAQDLVLALAARGQDLHRPGRLRGLLGPVLCSTPKEQDDFGERFDAWASGAVREPVDPGEETGTKALEVRQDRRWRPRSSRSRWWSGLVALAVLAFAAVFVWQDSPKPVVESNGGDTTIEDEGSREDEYKEGGVGDNGGKDDQPPVSTDLTAPWKPTLPVGLTLTVLSVLSAIAWWRYRGHLFISHWAVPEQPQIYRVAVEGLKGELFRGVSLSRTARDLRRRREIPSPELDVATTIDETLRRGGWLTPVYGKRQVIPEYLLLVDRTSYRDQQTRLMDELLERLRESGVLITRFYFDADPRTCFPFAEGGSPLTLRELASRYPDHHLLIFSDAGGLFNSRSGELEIWAEQFARWKDRAVFTPEPPAQWGSREWVLFRSFAVLPATEEGLASLIGSAGRGEPPDGPEKGVPGPFPTTLRVRPLRWLDRHPPDDSLVAETLAAVERYLGEEGTYWLRACAAYPTLDWNLTVYLGNVLQAAGGRKLLDTRRLAALARLPWFRHGHMPDWLRLLLVRQLSQEQMAGVRAALNRLLLSALGGTGGFVLHIARAKSLLRVLFRRDHEDSPLKDYVFVSFMAGRSLERPRTLRDLLVKLRALRELLVKLPRALGKLFPESRRVQEAFAVLFVVVLVSSFMMVQAVKWPPEPEPVTTPVTTLVTTPDTPPTGPMPPPLDPDKWKELFILAYKQLNHGGYEEAARLMQEARDLKEENGESVRLWGFLDVQYFPSYYLGRALQKSGNCEEALEEWRRFENGGHDARKLYKKLDKYRAECEALSG